MGGAAGLQQVSIGERDIAAKSKQQGLDQAGMTTIAAVIVYREGQVRTPVGDTYRTRGFEPQVRRRSADIAGRVYAAGKLPGFIVEAARIEHPTRLSQLDLEAPPLSSARYDFVLVPTQPQQARCGAGVTIDLEVFEVQPDTPCLNLGQIRHHAADAG